MRGDTTAIHEGEDGVQQNMLVQRILFSGSEGYSKSLYSPVYKTIQVFPRCFQGACQETLAMLVATVFESLAMLRISRCFPEEFSTLKSFVRRLTDVFWSF